MCNNSLTKYKYNKIHRNHWVYNILSNFQNHKTFSFNKILYEAKLNLIEMHFKLNKKVSLQEYVCVLILLSL